MLKELTFEMFEPLVGTTFRAKAGDLSVDLNLVRAEKVMENAASRLPRHPFSLYLAGPQQPFLGQRTFEFEHETLGTFAMFITAVENVSGGGFLYEAAFA